MPRVDMGGVWLLLTLVGCAACYLIAWREDKRQARERESMKRAAGQWKDRDAYDKHVRGESDEQSTHARQTR